MKKITFEKLHLKNFQGLSTEIDFNEKETSILAKNKSGKTRLYNAVAWIFFDKNSEFDTKFAVKTTDETGKEIKDLETVVELEIIFNEEIITLKKEYKKERKYFINNVPLKKKDYEERIEKIEKIENLKTLLNVYFFANLKWEEKREILINNFTNEKMFLEINEKYKDIDKDKIEDIKAENKASTKKIKEEIKGKKALIQEFAEIKEVEVDETKEKELEEKEEELKIIKETLKEEKEKDIKEIEDKIDIEIKKMTNINNDDANKELDVFYKKRAKIKKEIEDGKEEMLKTKRNKKNNFNNIKEMKEEEVKTIKREITEKEKGLNRLRKEFTKEKAKLEEAKKDREENKKLKFDENATICNFCKQDLPESQVVEMKENFNKNKVEEMKKINTAGKEAQSKIKEIKAEADEIKKEIEKDTEKLEEINKELEDILKEIEKDTESEEVKEKKNKIDKLEKILKELKEPVIAKKDTSEIENEINKLKKEKEIIKNRIIDISKLETNINNLKNELQLVAENNAIIKSDKARVEKAIEEKAELEETKAKVEQILERIKEYEEEKIKLVEETVNKHFDYVQFKMFEMYKNGEYKNSCTITHDGVNYSDFSQGEKIITGLDIIKTLANKLEVEFPIFIDNAESLTIKFKTNTQVIRLVADASEDKIKVK